MRRAQSGVGADAGLVAFLVPAGKADILPTETEVSEAENGASQLSLRQPEQDEGFLFTDRQTVRASDTVHTQIHSL